MRHRVPPTSAVRFSWIDLNISYIITILIVSKGGHSVVDLQYFRIFQSVTRGPWCQDPWRRCWPYQSWFMLSPRTTMEESESPTLQEPREAPNRSWKSLKAANWWAVFSKAISTCAIPATSEFQQRHTCLRILRRLFKGPQPSIRLW